MLAINLVTIPLCLGWRELDERLESFNIIVDVVFLLDVVRHFFQVLMFSQASWLLHVLGILLNPTAFVDWQGRVTTQGEVVMERSRVVPLYLRTWFIPDLISSIPIGVSVSLLFYYFYSRSDILNSDRGKCVPSFYYYYLFPI
jgi:hypothetical protein